MLQECVVSHSIVTEGQRNGSAASVSVSTVPVSPALISFAAAPLALCREFMPVATDQCGADD